MVQPLISRNISAEFLTFNHYIFGQVKVSNTGLMGALADAHISHIEINDASIARILKPDKVTNYVETHFLVKKQIFAICIAKREYIGSSSRSSYNRVFQYPVLITTPVYEIQGTLEWTGRFEFPVIMSDGSNPFLTLYDAKINAVLFPALAIESPIILVNRNCVDSLSTVKAS